MTFQSRLDTVALWLLDRVSLLACYKEDYSIVPVVVLKEKEAGGQHPSASFSLLTIYSCERKIFTLRLGSLPRLRETRL
jgi:hypothetical protein